jgi:hypothetical protein
MTPELRAELHALDKAGLEEVVDFVLARLSELHMQETGEEPIPVAERRVVVRERRTGAGTLRLEKVKCGKPGCKSCPHPHTGEGYWYLYFREGGKLKSRYIGKTLPPDLAG